MYFLPMEDITTDLSSAGKAVKKRIVLWPFLSPGEGVTTEITISDATLAEPAKGKHVHTLGPAISHLKTHPTVIPAPTARTHVQRSPL